MAIQKECMEFLNIFLIDKNQYDRMNDEQINGKIGTYVEFVEWNVKCLKGYNNEECIFFKHLCDKILLGKIGQMDMEYCVVWKTYSIFFDIHKNLILVHPR